MKERLVDRIASALLYEGYVLYPYRPSVKNQQRWTFGGIYPPAWSKLQDGTDPCVMQTQCLLEGSSDTKLRIRVRFLHLVDRTVGELNEAVDEMPTGIEPHFRPVRSIEVDGRQFQAWQEAVEREIDLGEMEVDRLLAAPQAATFAFPYQRTVEGVRRRDGLVSAILIRRQEGLEGTVEISVALLEGKLIQITARILNRTDLADEKAGGDGASSRDDALMRSLVSTHTILEAIGGMFVSQTAPPPAWQQHADRCANIGAWPVLVGGSGERGTMLSSPIIVEDYPRIAPQSPGDLFDGTEIDEILTLRIMTMTEDEKRVASGVDRRVRALLARTQSLAPEQLMGMHGTLREVEPPQGERSAHGLKAGDKVRLRPLGRADAMDICLDGKEATIVSIEEDFEDRVYVSVTVDEDPGKDLGLRGQPGHRFFFGVEEVELIAGIQSLDQTKAPL